MTNAVTLAGLGSTTPTIVSPTLISPVLGTPASGDLSNCTGVQYTGFKNRIINGNMAIDQRNAGASASVTGGDCSVDRFGMYYSGNSYTSQQSTVAPEGFKNSLLLTVTGTTTPTNSFFGQRIEGLNVADLGFGQSWAKTITVSFWVRSSVTGIYSIAITNGTGNRAYAVQYTINSANTWEYKTATIPGDTTGTWLTNNANGIYWRFNMGSPSGRTITAGSWQAANAAMDSVNLINAGQSEDMTDADWADAIARNKEHIEIMLKKDFWTDEDLTPFEDAVA